MPKNTYYTVVLIDNYNVNHLLQLINGHNKTEPLFLMVAHSAVHTGNPYEPIRAPDKDIDKFSYIKDQQRRKFAGFMFAF